MKFVLLFLNAETNKINPKINVNAINANHRFNTILNVNCIECNNYLDNKCQLYPTFENINLYINAKNINTIPHEYYSCDIARTDKTMCNGNNFSTKSTKSTNVK